MKVKKTTLIGLIVVLVLAIGGLSIYLVWRNNGAAAFASRIAAITGGGTPTTIEQYTEAVLAYDAEIKRLIELQHTDGTYYRVLASYYQDQGMYRQALDALEKAMEYYPDDASIYYLTGLSAGAIGNSYIDFDSDLDKGEAYNADAIANEYFLMAEDAFLKAMNIQTSIANTYASPYYALAVLYTYSMNRPAEAIPLIETYNQLVKNSPDAYMVLGNASYRAGQYLEAIAAFDTVIAMTTVTAETKATAEANKQQAWAKHYGN